MTIPSRPADISHQELRALVGEARCILEIGANDGTDTERFLAVYPAATVYAFECDPRPIARFEARKLGPRAILTRAALSDAAGVATFHQSSGQPRPDFRGEWDLSGSLCAPTGHLTYSPWCKFEHEITVQTETLDAWAAKHLEPDAIVDLAWVDTQGAEGKVIAGGRDTLARTRWLKIEAHRTRMYEGALLDAELIAMLPGWVCLGRYADDLVLHNARLADAT